MAWIDFSGSREASILHMPVVSKLSWRTQNTLQGKLEPWNYVSIGLRGEWTKQMPINKLLPYLLTRKRTIIPKYFFLLFKIYYREKTFVNK